MFRGGLPHGRVLGAVGLGGVWQGGGEVSMFSGWDRVLGAVD